MPDGNIFDEFKKTNASNLEGSATNSPVGSVGISLSESPDMAADFAFRSSPDGKTGAAILPSRFRAKKVASVKLQGDELDREIFATVSQAWDDGFDAVQVNNYTTKEGTTGSFVIVKDTAQIRSINAAFDPSRKKSANLMASLGTSAVGLLALGSMSIGSINTFQSTLIRSPWEIAIGYDTWPGEGNS